MLKKVLIILVSLMFSLSTVLYASSGGGAVAISSEDTMEETDVYGNPKSYKYYDYFQDMPKEYHYTAEEKKDNPDKYVTINFKAPNVSSATYNIGNKSGVIICDGIKYYLSNRNADGEFEKVTINNIEYRLHDGFIDATYTGEYMYNGRLYDVDYAGNLCAYKHKWIETVTDNQVYGDWEETEEYLFKYEIPFNTLWKNRPLTEEEKENLKSGPGVNLAPAGEYGLDGSLRIIGPHRKIEVTDGDRIVAKSPVAVKDPLNPMKAKSAKKVKK